MTAFLIVACITALFSAIGIWLGSYNTKAHPKMFDDWYVPAETRNVRQFLIVGSMHNMTYLGGATGMVAVLSWQIFDWIRQRFFIKQPMSLPTL
ncbi:MAG: hypothetical protein JWN25_2965 [Verrucomicrobiales bacterium]|nr:hypothetical protein [Verrucomicrobiales bacterium]